MIEKRPSFNSKVYRNVYSRRCDIEFLSHQTVQFRVQLYYIYMCSVVVLEVLLRHGLDFMNSDTHLALAASSTVVNVEVRRHLEAKIAQVISFGSFDVDAVYVVPDSDEEIEAVQTVFRTLNFVRSSPADLRGQCWRCGRQASVELLYAVGFSVPVAALCRPCLYDD